MAVITCPKCNQSYNIDEKLLGRIVVCNKCQAPINTRGVSANEDTATGCSRCDTPITLWVAGLIKTTTILLIILLAVTCVFVIPKYRNRDDAQQPSKRDDWATVRRNEQAQSNGVRLPVPEKVNIRLILPDNDVFCAMADEEARGNQYGYLRRAGWSHQEVVNYIIAKKYLPLIQYVTGREFISHKESLSADQWKRIKDQMVSRQLDGIIRNLAYLPPNAKSTDSNNLRYYNGADEDEYRKLLEQAFDHTIEAARKGETPRLTRQLNYSDAIKQKPALVRAIEDAANNIW